MCYPLAPENFPEGLLKNGFQSHSHSDPFDNFDTNCIQLGPSKMYTITKLQYSWSNNVRFQTIQLKLPT